VSALVAALLFDVEIDDGFSHPTELLEFMGETNRVLPAFEFPDGHGGVACCLP
jgi:hypothetical protein